MTRTSLKIAIVVLATLTFAIGAAVVNATPSISLPRPDVFDFFPW
jgi:hypothetical protein